MSLILMPCFSRETQEAQGWMVEARWVNESGIDWLQASQVEAKPCLDQSRCEALLVIASTFGDGDPPNQATDFADWLARHHHHQIPANTPPAVCRVWSGGQQLRTFLPPLGGLWTRVSSSEVQNDWCPWRSRVPKCKTTGALGNGRWRQWQSGWSISKVVRRDYCCFATTSTWRRGMHRPQTEFAGNVITAVLRHSTWTRDC